jgi:16S rRNA (adenine1518-N6/adenine1519-N6)-dimethyltransferase
MNFFFKKYLGQHFLRDREILNKIALLKKIKNETVVEIGPGKGALTEMIINQKPRKLIIIEKDKSLLPYLSKIKNKNSKEIEIIIGDALSINYEELSKDKIILIANLPYNIASTLIIKLVKKSDIFKSMVLMVLKEVAERLSAKVSSKEYGRISVLMQTQSVIKKCFDVSPDKFFPKPNVFSTVIKIEIKKKIEFNYQKLDEILKISFAQRRKTIKNNLKKLEMNVEKKIKECGLSPNLRPQDIRPEEFIKLSNILI